MQTEDKSQRRPVIDPLLLALKSRRVLVAIAALIVGLLVMAVPDLQPVQDQLLVMVVALALAVIGGYSVEDAARAGRERANEPPDDLKERIKKVLDGLVDETNF